MKLSTVLNLMEQDDKVAIIDNDSNLPINEALLFVGTVERAKKISKYRNAIVERLLPLECEMTIVIDISYQKRHQKGGDEK